MSALGELSNDLKRELKDGAGALLDPKHPHFDGTFIQVW